MYTYLIAVFVFVVDQLSKLAVLKWMNEGETIPIWEGVFHFTSHRNRGAAFGILQDQRWFFIIVTIIVVVGIIYYIQTSREMNGRMAWALPLILGGALGNFADRLMTGEVVDFLDFRLINYPIFNIADSAIVIGVGLFILDTFLESKKKSRVRI
ncbi:MAG: signal peptidase II [Bacillaceae bacterium]|nr:signal peptidase II [Bacillaceae bacterium]